MLKYLRMLIYTLVFTAVSVGCGFVGGVLYIDQWLDDADVSVTLHNLTEGVVEVRVVDPITKQPYVAKTIDTHVTIQFCTNYSKHVGKDKLPNSRC